MRPELQKMLSHCGMANNSGSQTTLVSSNQQCSGPLYTGVRQSVSKKTELPTQTSPANKWLPVKGRGVGSGDGGSQLQHMQQVSYHKVLLLCPILFHMEHLQQEGHLETPQAVVENAFMLSQPFTSLWQSCTCKSLHMPVSPAGLWMPWSPVHLTVSNFQHSA